MSCDHQIVLVADPRFPGGTSRALAAEAAALARAGLAAAFCPVLGPVIRRAPPVAPALRPHLESGTLRVIDPRKAARARIVIVHHPTIFTHLPHEPWGLEADRVILVLHHPPRDGLGRPAYDLDRIRANIAELFAAPVTLAPVGPAVRRQLAGECLEEDWSDLLDFDAWRRSRRRSGEGIVIGRHSRPQASKFPDTRGEALLAYPDRAGVRVRMLGFPPELADRYAPVPANWELLDFGAEDPVAFLEGLDYFVYHHGREWVEAFGYAILEAIAMEVPAVLPPEFEALFGASALYARPADTWSVIERLEADPEARTRHVHRARTLAEARLGLDAYLPRLDRVAPGWRAAHVAPPRGPRAFRAVLMTSNGIGLGHLSRMLAVARKLPEGSECAVLTLSQSFALAEKAGYLTQHIPFHAATGASVESWNAALAAEAGDFLDLVAPDVFVFDGNVPYQGMIAALDQRPAIRRVWMRRALWSSAAGPVEREAAFDLVIEPGELSSRFDTGATAGGAGVTVAPIVQVLPHEMLPREAARSELGLTPGPLHVGMMLGAGANFDFKGIRARIVEDLARRPGVELTEFVAPAGAGTPAAAGPHRQVRHYPAARLFPAFDLMILGAGYNTFHEALGGGVPAVFVPNEAEEMDLQILRARHARSIGCAEMLRATDLIRTASVLDRALDPAVRQGMRQRMSRLSFPDGARQAADLIAAIAAMSRLSCGFQAESRAPFS